MSELLFFTSSMSRQKAASLDRWLDAPDLAPPDFEEPFLYTSSISFLGWSLFLSSRALK